MKLSSIEIFRYDLPLIRPVFIGKNSMCVRSGIVLRIKDETGHMGYGEVAPLAGFHYETIDQALTQLFHVKHLLVGEEIPDNIAKLDGSFEDLLGRLGLLPSVRFGMEVALLNLLADRTGVAFHELISDAVHNEVYINGLLMGDCDTVKEDAAYMARQGYRSIKLKVGHQSVTSDINMVKEVRGIIGRGISLRLDANRAWPLDKAVAFGQAVKEYDIEYIEEPVDDPDMFSIFFRKTGIGVALDESFDPARSKFFMTDPAIKGLILKPSFLGGLEKTVKLIGEARALGVFPVISSAFYSGIGLSALAMVTAAFIPEGTAMGLDTYRLMKEDLLVKPFRASHGRIDIVQISADCQNIRTDFLRPVPQSV